MRSAVVVACLACAAPPGIATIVEHRIMRANTHPT